MFEITWTNHEQMWQKTQENFKKIKGIEEIIQLQNELFGSNFQGVCFGDAQIDGLEYPPAHDRLTVYICYYANLKYRNKIATNVHYVIDFFEPEIVYFDIEFNTHWIDEVMIQKNQDGKYSISFGMGELDFRYSNAEVNRCWVETEK